jgi:Holliday junction resolvase RusA-like endonuclease
MTKPVTIDLPMPPSTNKLWRRSGTRVYLDARYIAWKRTAGWELVRQKPDRFPPGAQVAVTIRLGKSKRARDADNCAKGILDLLQAHGIVKNDRDVVDLRITWDAGIEPGRVLVEARAIERSAA